MFGLKNWGAATESINNSRNYAMWQQMKANLEHEVATLKYRIECQEKHFNDKLEAICDHFNIELVEVKPNEKRYIVKDKKSKI